MINFIKFLLSMPCPAIVRAVGYEDVPYIFIVGALYNREYRCRNEMEMSDRALAAFIIIGVLSTCAWILRYYLF